MGWPVVQIGALNVNLKGGGRSLPRAKSKGLSTRHGLGSLVQSTRPLALAHFVEGHRVIAVFLPFGRS